MEIESRSQTRFNNFDFLRLFAATMVLVSHCYPIFGRGNEEFFAVLFGFNTAGGVAVDIFFLISGFLLTSSLERQPSLWKFAAARALRIFPALAVLVFLCVFILGPAFTTLSIEEYFRAPGTMNYLQTISVFFLQFSLPGVFEGAPNRSVNGSLWSLPVELAMYFVLVFFHKVGALRRPFVLLIPVAFFAAHIISQSQFGLSPKNHGLVLLSVPLHSFLMLGVWFFIGAAYSVCKDKLEVSPVLALACIVLLIGSIRSPVVDLAAFIAIPYLTFCLAFCKIPLWRITKPFGDLSYGVYLYAFPVQQSVFALLGGSLSFHSMMLISLIITFLFAHLSWTLVEKPALELKPR